MSVVAAIGSFHRIRCALILRATVSVHRLRSPSLFWRRSQRILRSIAFVAAVAIARALSLCSDTVRRRIAETVSVQRVRRQK